MCNCSVSGIRSRVIAHDRNGSPFLHDSTRTRCSQRRYDHQLPVHNTCYTRLAIAKLSRLEAIHESDRGHSGYSRASHRLHSMATVGEQACPVVNTSFIVMHISGMVGELRLTTEPYR